MGTNCSMTALRCTTKTASSMAVLSRWIWSCMWLTASPCLPTCVSVVCGAVIRESSIHSTESASSSSSTDGNKGYAADTDSGIPSAVGAQSRKAEDKRALVSCSLQEREGAVLPGEYGQDCLVLLRTLKRRRHLHACRRVYFKQ